MRLRFAFLLLAALPAGAQILTFGIKAGVPLTDPYSAGSGENVTSTAYYDRFIIGPTVQLHLVPRLSFEVDALYRRSGFTYSFTGFAPGTPEYIPPSSSTTTVNDWQFPFMGKYELHGGPIRPFVDIGFTLRHISEAPNSNVGGGTVGGGVSIRLLSIRLAPEIRYTRWGSHAFNEGSGMLVSSLNQVDVLVGLTF